MSNGHANGGTGGVKAMAIKIVWTYVVVLTTLSAGTAIAQETRDRPANVQGKSVYALPADIARMLRERNHEGRGGCDRSSIFVHGFHFLPDPGVTTRTLWFLGAPDYLCRTKSFAAVTLERGGRWTLGLSSQEDWEGSRLLTGIPKLFVASEELGLFLTTESAVPGPGNFMYYSKQGVTWSPLELPAPSPKSHDVGCCHAPVVRQLCVSAEGAVFVSYYESEAFQAGTWSATVDASFPGTVAWSPISSVPDTADCDEVRYREFVPASLVEKTDLGALFDVSYDYAVLIPGATR